MQIQLTHNILTVTFHRVVRLDPAIIVSMSGTVDITSVGMFGGGHNGWGLTPTGTSLGLVVGGTAWKPAIVEGRVEPRKILNLTVVSTTT